MLMLTYLTRCYISVLQVYLDIPLAADPHVFLPLVIVPPKLATPASPLLASAVGP